MDNNSSTVNEVLQNLISEIEHRNITKMLHMEFYSIITMKCRICNYVNRNDFFNSIDYFMNKKYKIRSVWCSETCFDCEDEINKMMVENYAKSVNEYMLKDTIQYEKHVVFEIMNQ